MNSLQSSFLAVAKPVGSGVRLAPARRGRVSACLSVPPPPPSSAAVGAPPRELSAASRAVIEDEARYLVGTYNRSRVVIVSGRGCKLYDIDGREYLDMAAGIAVNALGHADPDLVAVLADQAGTLVHISNTVYSVPQVELAKRLVDTSFADRVFLANTGTEANEAAIKFSRKFQRAAHPSGNAPVEFLAFSNCFHGRTMGALALTSKSQYREPFEPVMPGVSFAEYGNLEEAREVIRSGRIAAVFVEPVQGEGGVHSATKEFLQGLREACDQAGALLVFDEVQCGLGRTGYLWAHEAYDGVTPDMLTVAKPLANGLPIGAVLLTEKVAAAISYGDHGTTYGGNPFVTRAAITVFDRIRDPSFLAEVSRKGERFKRLLRTKLGGNPHVREVRGVGLIIGVQLDVPAAPLVSACLDAGVVVLTAGKGDVVRLVPPLVISDEELEHAAGVIADCLSALD